MQPVAAMVHVTNLMLQASAIIWSWGWQDLDRGPWVLTDDLW